MPYICLAIPAVMGVGGGGHPRSGYPGDVAGASYVTSTTSWTLVGLARPDPVWLSRIGLATVGHMPTPVWLSRISWKYIYIYIYITLLFANSRKIKLVNRHRISVFVITLKNQWGWTEILHSTQLESTTTRYTNWIKPLHYIPRLCKTALWAIGQNAQLMSPL